MATAKVGHKAPDFTLNDADGNKCKLSDFRGEKVVLYFYPKDDTSGCTAQACGFRDEQPKFKKLNTKVIGVSPDNEKAHTKFIAKYELPFMLLCDPEHTVSETYEVWKEKSMYGKKYMGIERSTFIIDEEGKLVAEFRKVKVPGHVEEVIAALKA